MGCSDDDWEIRALIGGSSLRCEVRSQQRVIRECEMRARR